MLFRATISSVNRLVASVARNVASILIEAGPATFSGQSGMNVGDWIRNRNMSAVLSGVSSFTAAIQRTRFMSGLFLGSSSFTAIAVRERNNSAVFSAESAFVAVINCTRFLDGLFEGVGSLTCSIFGATRTLGATISSAGFLIPPTAYKRAVKTFSDGSSADFSNGTQRTYTI